MDELVISLISPLFYPFLVGQRVYWLFLLAALCVAVIAYILKKPRSPDGTRLKLLAWLFPRAIYRHPSTRLDLKYFYVNTVFQSMFILPLFAGANLAISTWVRSSLDEHVLFGAGALSADNIWILAFFTLLVVTAMDLGIFIGHLLQHKLPLLWEFHKVHHSAEVLNPLTVYRMHPVDNLLTMALSGLLVGCVNGVYQYAAGGEGLVLNVLGVNLFVFLFYMMAYNLRHSHIWVSYGPWLSQVLISPAQHQIHHSAELRHRDKNMGFMFAVWDKLAGTLYVPREEESFRLGIGEEDGKAFDSVLNLYRVPFARMRRYFTAGGRARQVMLLGLLVVILSPFGFFNVSQTAALPQVKRTVYLEELTWQEVQAAIRSGATTVIIPTGGTEQNGPHMQLGKHNQIVHYTAGRMAETLGNTLVAPVMSYVPEGSIEPTSGHMRFAGTLSVPEEVFEATLEHTARSLRAHGFTLICFVGDSGGNQAAQERVSRRLDADWKDAGFRVMHVGDYYSRNGQDALLKNHGHVDQVIGKHAGVRDTSELLAVYPQGIREELLADNRTGEFDELGADGVSSRASTDLGQQLLRLKIQAGRNQIRRTRGF